MSPPELRVVFVQGTAERAGAERALAARVRHLPEQGIEPVVAFLADGPFRAELERAGVRTLRLCDNPPLRRPHRLPAVIREIASTARAEHADLLEGCGEKVSLLAGFAARSAGCAAVYNLQDEPRRSAAASLVQAGALLGRHDAVVVPSRWMAAAFRRRLRLQAEVIPNGVIVEDLPAEPADVRGLAGWPADAPVVGFFGRLVRWKGVEVLLRAIGSLDERVRLLIVGGTLYGLEPSHPAQLAALAGELGLDGRVHFTGHREDALALMSGCDVVAHCSVRPEPFGLVVAEAMALGRAVVATRTGGPEEIVENGRTGVLVEPGDGRQLAEELGALLDDTRRRSQLGQAARAAAAAEYDSARLAVRLAALYRAAAAKTR